MSTIRPGDVALARLEDETHIMRATVLLDLAAQELAHLMSRHARGMQRKVEHVAVDARVYWELLRTEEAPR